jgi:ribosomal protein L11 methyltransferase
MTDARSTVVVPPCWQVLAPGAAAEPGRVPIVLARGRSFGDGRHPTTQLCLQAIAACAPRHGGDWRMLDLGCGSGILAIAAARLGAQVDAVDVDSTALDEAAANLRGNGVGERVRLATDLATCHGPYALIVANILRGVLLEVATDLAARLAADATLVLSGLVATDVPVVTARYAPLLDRPPPQIVAQQEWRALAWRSARCLTPAGSTTSRP